MKNLTLIVLLGLAACVTARYRRRCERKCSEDVNIVCGSDQKIYWNDCALWNARCKNKKLRKAHNGPCKAAFSILRGLPYNPVCGSDWNTYSSVAYLNLASCLKNKKIKVRSSGSCACRHPYSKKPCLKGNNCRTGCPIVINPVCGNDGKTYANECVLDKVNCIFGGNAVKKFHNGFCQSLLETAIGSPKFAPVCGSDGNTYSNDQYIRVAQCQNHYLVKVAHGFCKSKKH